MFSRNRTPAEAAAPETERPARQAVGGKGRPTPRRKEREAARRRPLGGVDRRTAAKEQRARLKEQREREYQAMLTGDERYMPLRDRGPVRRWVRDYVDARRNLGEYFLPVSIGMVFLTLLAQSNPGLTLLVLGLLYLVVFAAIIDGFVLSRRLKKKLAAKFGEAVLPRGTLVYGVLRAFQMRRTRLPRPQVARGQFPS